MSDVKIRVATVEDAEEILAIYAEYVKNTVITVEFLVPSIEEFRKRIESTLMKFPYYVAILNDKIIGYAYAGSFRSRRGFDWTAETSIYLEPTYKGGGIGRLLYNKVEESLKMQGVQLLIACITQPNLESTAFHEHLGFTEVGCFHECAYKNGEWLDIGWYEKKIGTEIKGEPSEVQLFSDN